MNSLDLVSDWEENFDSTHDVSEYLSDFNIPYKGPGWYLTNTETILVIVYGLTDTPWAMKQPVETCFKLFYWSRPNVGSIFGEIANAPTRNDTRFSCIT